MHLSAQVRYAELYRPQFHATPRTGFMGDPNGPNKFSDTYHLYWWGHMISDDMVYWQELTSNALKGTPSGYGNWSGCVAVDLENTAGFNTAEDTAMIAVYTLNDNNTGVQHQAISVSLDQGSFDYYNGNPVIQSNQADFRDPQVFWHEPTSKWVMVITKPIDRAIEFYTSSDIKVWSYKSKFQGRGARREIWEVPDLFQLTLNGNVNDQRWVLTCGMGPNRMQYWVGDFDGTKFTLASDDNLLTGNQIKGDLLADFEADYTGWTVEGTAFGSAPASGTLADQQEVMGYTGYKLVNSFLGGDGPTGKMISDDFTITKKFINLQIGGGSGSGLSFKVISEGVELANIRSTGDTEILQWRGIDLSAHAGKTAHIEIEDEATGGWGHILVDHIVFSDYEYDTRIENANWADWGHDFYAGKSFRNYDGDDTRKIWLAWMGNWTYARDVPTNPWKGCESIPRSLSLVNEGNGYELVQKPIVELEKLRDVTYSKSNFSVEGTQEITGFQPDWNVYELKVSFKITGDNQVFGLNLAEGDDHKLEVRFDTHNSVLSVNRGTKPFSFAYKRITETPIIIPEDSILDLHIFVDQSSVEILANDYKVSTTSLFFNLPTSTGISIFSDNGLVQVPEFQAWSLKSIWGISVEDMVLPEDPGTGTPLGLDQKKKLIYPNPVRRGEKLILGNPETEEVKLFDLSGQIQPIRKIQNDQFIIPEEVSPGVYFLLVRNADSVVKKKLIVR